MIAMLLGLIALGALSAEPVLLHPVGWLGDLVVAGETLLVGTVGQVLEVDFEGRIVRTLPFPGGPVHSLLLGPDFLVAGGWDSLRIWSWPEGEVRGDIRGVRSIARDLALGRGLILAAGSDGVVRAFSVVDGQIVWSLQAHAGSVWGIAACSSFWATAGNDRVALWDLETRTEIFSFPGRGWDVDFSPNGFLLAGGMGKILKVWDTAVGFPLWEVWAHESCTVAVAFSSNGKWVASGSLDWTAAVWDAESGELLRRLEGFSALISAVRFSPDGQLLVVGAEDGTLALLPLP